MQLYQVEGRPVFEDFEFVCAFTSADFKLVYSATYDDVSGHVNLIACVTTLHHDEFPVAELRPVTNEATTMVNLRIAFVDPYSKGRFILIA